MCGMNMIYCKFVFLYNMEAALNVVVKFLIVCVSTPTFARRAMCSYLPTIYVTSYHIIYMATNQKKGKKFDNCCGFCKIGIL